MSDDHSPAASRSDMPISTGMARQPSRQDVSVPTRKPIGGSGARALDDFDGRVLLIARASCLDH